MNEAKARIKSELGWDESTWQTALTSLGLVDFHVPFPYIPKGKPFYYATWMPKAYLKENGTPYFNPKVDMVDDSGKVVKNGFKLSYYTTVKYENMPTAKAVAEGLFEYCRPKLVGWLTQFVSYNKLLKVLKQWNNAHGEIELFEPKQIEALEKPTPINKPIQPVTELTLWEWLKELDEYDKIMIIGVYNEVDKAIVLYTGEVGSVSIGLAKQPITDANVHIYKDWKAIFCNIDTTK